MAVFNGVLGLNASLYATPLWAVLGLVSIVLTARLLFGDGVGLLSGLFLLLTPLEIYFARYPTAEALTQFLIWGGLYALVRYQDEEAPLWGVIAGMGLGEVFLARIDALPILLVPGIVFALALRNDRLSHSLWFLVPFGLLVGQALLQAIAFSWPYTWDTYSNLVRYGFNLLKRYGLVFVALGGMAVAGYLLLRVRLKVKWSHLTVLFRWGLAASLLGLAVYAYFVRPRIGETVMAPYWYGDSVIPIMNHLNMVRLAWYLTPLGVWLGVAGAIWMVVREPWRRTWSVLAVGLCFSTLYLFNILNNPFHIYAMRRYIPAVLPFLMIGAALALVRLRQCRLWWRYAPVAATLVSLCLAGWLGYASRSVWTLVEYQGLSDQISDLAQQIEPGAILLFDDHGPVGAGSTIGTPLQYLYGFTVFDLQEDQLSLPALTQAVVKWQREDRPVYWVEGPEPVLGPPEALLPEPAFGYWLISERLEQSYDKFPVDRVPYRIPLEFYRLLPLASSSACTLPLMIDIGTLDTAYLEGGFYGKDMLGSRSVRWTDGDALLALPCSLVDPQGSVTVSVTLASLRGSDEGPTEVSVLADGVTLWHAGIGHDFETIRFTVPATALADMALRIKSDTWVPSEAGVGADDRNLGVLLDEVIITECADGQ